MPGKRPIDIGQHSADRGILKRNTTGVIHNLKEENLSGFANKENSLGQFGATTSAELAAIITDESGSGSLIFGTTPTIDEPEINEPVINTIKIDTTSKIVTANLLTGSTTVVPIMQFPLYEGNLATNDYNVIGCIEFTIQTEVGNTTGSTLPTKLTKRKITKILAALNHDYEAQGITQTPSVNFVEYGNTYTSVSDFAVYSVVYDSTDKMFELRVAPLSTSRMFHRVTALCTVGVDKVWSTGYIAVE
jgi:hypothetical protein